MCYYHIIYIIYVYIIRYRRHRPSVYNMCDDDQTLLDDNKFNISIYVILCIITRVMNKYKFPGRFVRVRLSLPR